LIYGDTERSPALRHELPVAIGDPFLYLEADGRRAVITNALEEDRIAAVAPDIERLLQDALGSDALLAEGRTRADADAEVCVRAVAALGTARRLCRLTSRSRWRTGCEPRASSSRPTRLPSPSAAAALGVPVSSPT
jgi:hypothetical protein